MGTIIYTCITNNYDSLKEIKTSHRAICFTDMDILSDSWEIVKIKDEPKLNRKIKICPHLFLPEHDRNVWIDGSGRPNNIDDIIDGKTGFWCMKHPKRTCAYAEGIYCIDIKKDSEKNIMAQLNKYFSEGFPQSNGLVCGGFLIRDNSPINKKFAEKWWKEFNNGSGRDQISFPYVAWKLNFSYQTMPFLDNCFANKHRSDLDRLAAKLAGVKLDISEIILISGENREECALILEPLRTLSDRILNCEPFDARSFVSPLPVQVNEYSYLPQNDKETVLRDEVEAVLTFKKYSDWTLRYCSENQIIQGKKLIISNLKIHNLFPWLVTTFSLGHKPIYLLRHPIGQAWAKLKRSRSNKDLANNNTDNNCQIPAGIPAAHHRFIADLDNDSEIAVALWCIHNKKTLSIESEATKWVTVYYEYLIIQPEAEFCALWKAIGLSNDDRKHLNLQISEWVNVGGGTTKNQHSRLEEWLRAFSPTELKKFQAIFEYFDIRCYSAYHALPLFSSLS